MKKLLAIAALAGFVAAGCASHDMNRGGTSDTMNNGYGTDTSAPGKLGNTTTNSSTIDNSGSKDTSSQSDTGRADNPPKVNDNNTPPPQ